jgi:hypothetical protein
MKCFVSTLCVALLLVVAGNLLQAPASQVSDTSIDFAMLDAPADVPVLTVALRGSCSGGGCANGQCGQPVVPAEPTLRLEYRRLPNELRETATTLKSTTTTTTCESVSESANESNGRRRIAVAAVAGAAIATKGIFGRERRMERRATRRGG